jgi:hypothetical protein
MVHDGRTDGPRATSYWLEANKLVILPPCLTPATLGELAAGRLHLGSTRPARPYVCIHTYVHEPQ